jgi:hypothetical protein
MQLTVPKGIEITQTTNKEIKIRIPNTDFWVIGEQLKTKLWNIYVYNPETKKSKLVRQNKTTKFFAMFSGIILKKQLPYPKQKIKDMKVIIKFIKKITK